MTDISEVEIAFPQDENECEVVAIEGDAVFLVRSMSYPFFLNGVSYERFVVVDENNTPVSFLITEPKNIVYRLPPYSDEKLEIVAKAAREAQDKSEIEGTTGDYYYS